jgi:hypothetical protein
LNFDIDLKLIEVLKLLEEKVYWEKLILKFVRLTKTSNGKDLHYSGVIKAVFDDKIIIDEIKFGEIPLTFNGLSVREVKDGDSI